MRSKELTARGLVLKLNAACAAAVGLILAHTACGDRSPSQRTDTTAAASTSVSPPVASAASAPPYLQPVFRSLDSLLTDGQRDTLRAMAPDTAFLYRTRGLAPLVERKTVEWSRSTAADTLRAHGEPSPDVMPAIFLDLYQQHLRGEAINLAAALERLSGDAWTDGVTVSVDSVLLRQELDSRSAPDQLVREARKKSLGDDGSFTEHRLALYLDGAAPTATSPTWAARWNEDGSPTLEHRLPVDGGTLLVISVPSADANEQLVLDVRRGAVYRLVHQQIDYGQGSFAIRVDGQRILIDATGELLLGADRISPAIQCSSSTWPASTLLFDAAARRFVVERSMCLPHR